MALGLALSLPATQIRADEQSKLTLARELVAVAQVHNLIPVLLNTLKRLMAKDPGDEAEKKAFSDRIEAKAAAESDDLLDQGAHVYADAFSEEDLATLIAFYKSPTGQRLIAKQLEISANLGRLGRAWGSKLAKEVLEDQAKEQATQPQTNEPGSK